jgi:hypothetical protein
LKASDEIKSAAMEAAGGAKNDDEKIAALIHSVRTPVRDLFGEDVTDAERERTSGSTICGTSSPRC